MSPGITRWDGNPPENETGIINAAPPLESGPPSEARSKWQNANDLTEII